MSDVVPGDLGTIYDIFNKCAVECRVVEVYTDGRVLVEPLVPVKAWSRCNVSPGGFVKSEGQHDGSKNQ